MTTTKLHFRKQIKLYFCLSFKEKKSEFQSTILNVKFARRNDLRSNDDLIYFVNYFLLLVMYIIVCISVPDGFSKIFYKLQ